MRTGLFIAMVVAVLAGCNRPPPSPPVRPVAGYDFEVHRPGGGYTKGQAATFTVQDEANVVELKNGRLTVNGKQYGAIADNAKIVVKENGEVTVDGRDRLPE